MRALAILAAALLATGCAHPVVIHEPVEVEVVRYETIPVPASLLGVCKIAPLDIKTNADIEQALADALIELKRCTADKEAIRALD